MKIKTESLRAAFAFAGRAAAKSTTIDILKTVRFVANDGKFTLACNNLHLYAEARGECGTGSLEFCVKADRFGHALSTAGEEVDLKLDKTLAWKSGGARYTMAVLPVADFPVPKLDGEPLVTIEDETIVEHIARVSFACGTKGVKSYTLGVGLESKTGELTATATDDHRLATIAINKGSYDDFSALIHREVVSALPPSATEARVFAQRIEFVYPSGILIAMLLEGQLPDWRRDFAKEGAETIKLSRPQQLGAIKAALPFDELASVHLVMKEGTLHVEGVDRDDKAEHAVAATGPDLDIWFLSSALTPALQAVKSDDLSLQFSKDAHGRRHLLIEDGPMRCVSAPYGR